MSELKIFKRTIIRDRNGKIKFDSGLEPSHSFVWAFINHIYGASRNVNVLSIPDTSNASQTIRRPSSAPERRNEIDAADDTDTYGIVVGTGTTPEANTDYALATQIAHGTGAGQLDYGAHSFTAPAIVGDNADFVVSREFYNDSGGSITVREIGIYCLSYVNYFCTLRDVLVTPVVVDNTETLTIQYTFRTTV